MSGMNGINKHLDVTLSTDEKTEMGLFMADINQRGQVFDKSKAKNAPISWKQPINWLNSNSGSEKSDFFQFKLNDPSIFRVILDGDALGRKDPQ